MNNIFRISEVILLILSVILIHSCKKKEEVPVLIPTKTIFISTISVTSITPITATSGGNINTNSLTGISVTARGVCWSTSANPTIALATKTSDGTGYGHFSSSITGLTPDTTYFVRAYATDDTDTIYGNEEVFTTTSTTNGITISTTGITAITGTTAVTGGNITSYGGTLVTARGVCWSTSANPTIALATKTSDGTGFGEFSSSITGLLTNSTYYVRAYATNSIGTAYGNEWILKTYTGTVTDIDLNVYNTVTIGSQVWMAENLNTTKYNDGTAIPNVTVDAEWDALITGAYSDYANNPANSTTYGRLYNWYVVDNNASTKVASNGGKNVCPTNWHIPTDAEWTTLITYLGGESVAGGKLKETDITHWLSPNTGATNESGFTAVPGGVRDHDGSYEVGLSGYWWSSTEYSTTLVWGRYMYYIFTNVTSYFSSKQYGFSVRCLKDN